MKKIINKLLQVIRLDLYLYNIKWKTKNKHNQTYPINIFPMDLVDVDEDSYGPLEVLYWGSEGEKLQIGKYVSIASGCKFLLGGNHPTNTLTTFPLKVKKWNYDVEAISKGPIIVEDDVWIGTNVLILSGLTIGKGAVIAAGSVVTKSIPPYSIVGGNPAKHIKFRVPESLIPRLMNLDLKKIINQPRPLIEKLTYSPITESLLEEIEKI